MLAQQQKIQLSSYSRLYDLVIPKDNLLRKIGELIDFTFIYDELLDKYCSNNGRMAESPVRMFKYLLLKTNDSDDLEKELAYCKELEKCIESDQTLSLLPAVKEKLNLLKETVEASQENYILSKDKDAKTGHKSADSKFFGYKTHLAMTEERIITAAVVTSGEKGDGPELPMLLELSRDNGIQVDTIIGDSAYS